ncbi:fungal specific transcription factor domain-containing protein [Histoplasma capsulatum G186AR]|uniref:Fungal specific transcription factor domain-containing protein n=2 Tax=Ajellomyces capsulatus TaxID=5037 RepID=C0NVZ7_AJECG|nr:fungal specific transcription factor domain-containing protein [Histoplasma capsulatum G186AR]EEH04686.1 fungal specific transcription factor domain-containing protein [Histoplasma capsulatum G186AR]
MYVENSRLPWKGNNDPWSQPSSPKQSALDSKVAAWDAYQHVSTTTGNGPSVTAGSSPGRVTPSNSHLAPPTSVLRETDRATLYTNTTSSVPLPQLHESRSYDESPGASSFLGRSEYLRGEVPINENRAKSYPAVASESLTEEDIRILQLQHAFDLPPRAVREGLIDAFMKRCAPWMPIVERSWLAEGHGNQPSLLLLQAVFLAGSRVSSAPAVAAYASPNEFYRRAKALFWSGYEKNPVTMITAVLVMHWYNPEGPEHISLNTSGFWNRIGVGLAFQIGLHKEPPPGRNAALRRRLWWTLYARDCLISASHGRPRAINPDDCDVRPLYNGDFYESTADGPMFISYVELASLLGDLTQCCCRKYLSRQKRQYIEGALYRWTRELPEHLQLFRRASPNQGTSPKLVPAPYSFEARQLHVLYFVILAILFRTTPPASTPSPAAVLASSFVAGIFEDFLARDEIRFLGPEFTFYVLASGVGLLSCFPYPHLWAKAERDLRIIYNSQKELSTRWPSAIGSLNALQSMKAEASKTQRHKDAQMIGSLAPEQLSYFSGFGTDLCRIGEAILTHHIQDLLGPRRIYDDQSSRSASDMMTAGILAELKTPIAGPTALDGYQPLATILEHHPMQSASSRVTTDITGDIFCGQYAGIGDWLLKDWDWNSAIAW